MDFEAIKSFLDWFEAAFESLWSFFENFLNEIKAIVGSEEAEEGEEEVTGE